MRDDPLFEYYKRARNRLRQANPESFIGLAVNALFQAYNGGIGVLRTYQPWNILLAIKWAIQEADDMSHRRRPATRNDLHVVLNILHDLEANVTMPSSYEHV